MGKVVTFYSYKGGTGRSMALANVAWILASQGRSVLMIDWDLEAPGLHRYFAPFLPDRRLLAPETQGLIEFVRSYAAQTATPSPTRPNDWYKAYVDIAAWGTLLRWPDQSPLIFGERGLIKLVPAGRQTTEYAEAVNAFNWQKFYTDQSGGAFFDMVRDKARNDFDYVLIDSRTGVSDTSGISTIQMPDALVVCYTYNVQSIEGASDIASRVRAKRPDLPVFPVAMRVESQESDLLEQMRRYAFDSFSGLVDPKLVPDLVSYFDRMEVPYYTKYAYWERLTPFEDRPGAATGSIYRQMVQLAGLVAGEDIRDQPVPAERKEQVMALFRDAAAAAAIVKTVPVAERINRWHLAWATAALIVALAFARVLWREPGTGQHVANLILATVGLVPVATGPEAPLQLPPLPTLLETQLGALLETAALPEPAHGREFLEGFRSRGIPVVAVPDGAYYAQWRIDESRGRLLGCGSTGFSVWRLDNGQLLVRSNNVPYVTSCDFMPKPNVVVVTNDQTIEVYDWQDLQPAFPIPAVPIKRQPSPYAIPPASKDTRRSITLTEGGRFATVVDDATSVSGAIDATVNGFIDATVWELGLREPTVVGKRRFRSSYYGSMSVLGTGLVVALQPPMPNKSTLLVMRVGRGDPTPPTVLTLPDGFFFVPPTGAQDRFVVTSSNEVRVSDIKTGLPSGSATYEGSIGPIAFSADGQHIAIMSSNNSTNRVDVRSVPDFQVEWSATDVLAGNLALGEHGMTILAGTNVYRRDHQLAAGTASDSWSNLMGALRGYTKLCLAESDRGRILLELPEVARRRFEACETSQGRTIQQTYLTETVSDKDGRFSVGQSQSYPISLWFFQPDAPPLRHVISQPLKNGQHLEVTLTKGSIKVTVDEKPSPAEKPGSPDGRIKDQGGNTLPNVPILTTIPR